MAVMGRSLRHVWKFSGDLSFRSSLRSPSSPQPDPCCASALKILSRPETFSLADACAAYVDHTRQHGQTEPVATRGRTIGQLLNPGGSRPQPRSTQLKIDPVRLRP